MFELLDSPTDAEALRVGDRALTYRELAAAAGALAAELPAAPARVAVWATPSLETAVAVVGCLLAGVPAVPLNPKLGARELEHIVDDSRPDLVLHEPGIALPATLAALPRAEVATCRQVAPTRGHLSTAGTEAGLIVYTSGTTGPPKGVVLPRRALAATLDALADAWQWTEDDVVVHGLPLFHVHGLVLGILGPLRRGGAVHHLGRFSPEALGSALAEHSRHRSTVVFGVPTMYHRLAETLVGDEALAAVLRSARLLVSGSAALPLREHERITAATGQHVIERYGMTETLMNTSVRVDGPPRPGTVGVPLPGTRLRIVDEDGSEITARDAASIGEIQVRGPNLFTEYLNRPDATAEAFDGEWFRTGDMATVDAEGCVRIVGRKSTDLIKSGGYKIGAGEIENALLEHPGVAEVAVTGEPDADLGERIVAWVVPAGEQPAADELADHVASLLSPHKRPRVVHFIDALPRNALGKVTKGALS